MIERRCVPMSCMFCHLFVESLRLFHLVRRSSNITPDRSSRVLKNLPSDPKTVLHAPIAPPPPLASGSSERPAQVDTNFMRRQKFFYYVARRYGRVTGDAPPPPSLGHDPLGAAEVCLTDGDEESLKLTQRNVTDNLRPDFSPRSPSTASCCDEQQAQDATSAEEERTGCNADSKGGSTNSVESSADRRPPPATAATISVQKLRWGCADDMHAAGVPLGGDGDSGSSRAWDVVLGSDIAALPYASAYGDLLQTIVSLVNNTKGSGQGNHTASSPPRTISDHVTREDQNTEISNTAASDSCEALDGSGCESGRRKPAINKTSPMKGLMTEAGRSRSERAGRRRVVVLLAHKRRHVSEEAFFEDLREELGGEKSVRGTSEDDVHPDFRGTGIRLHMFVVDV
ncbi:unnamed protein product [Ectocarpus sp. 8 AP-2014]